MSYRNMPGHGDEATWGAINPGDPRYDDRGGEYDHEYDMQDEIDKYLEDTLFSDWS